MGVWVGGHPWANFSYRSKDAQENSTSYLTVLEGDGAKIVPKYKNRIPVLSGYCTKMLVSPESALLAEPFAVSRSGNSTYLSIG